jgi:hypothetical protein
MTHAMSVRHDLALKYGDVVLRAAILLLRACAPDQMYPGVSLRKVLAARYTQSHAEEEEDDDSRNMKEKILGCAALLAAVGVGGVLANYRTNLCVFIAV